MMKLLALFFFGLMYQVAPQNELQLNIENIKSNQGVIRLLVFDKADGFPNNPEKAIRKETLSIQNLKASFILKNLPKGDYAIAVFHDSQNQGKIRTNSFGVPLDSYGFSNNATGTFGPPSFSKASFQISGSKTQHTIKLR